MLIEETGSKNVKMTVQSREKEIRFRSQAFNFRFRPHQLTYIDFVFILCEYFQLHDELLIAYYLSSIQYVHISW